MILDPELEMYRFFFQSSLAEKMEKVKNFLII